MLQHLAWIICIPRPRTIMRYFLRFFVMNTRTIFLTGKSLRNHRRRVSNLCIISIKYDCNLLKAIAFCFRIEEVGRKCENDQDGKEDKVILPSDSGQCNWVDESVEKDCKYGCKPCNSQTTGSEAESPDFTGVGGQKGRAGKEKLLISFSSYQEILEASIERIDLQSDIITSKENEEEGDDSSPNP